MNATTILVAGLLGLLVGLLISYSFIKKIIRIYRTPTYNISTLPPKGYGEVVGKAAGKTVNSPLTGKACVFWQLKLTQRVGKATRTLYDHASKETFTVSDGTGEVQIVPAGAEFILRPEFNSNSHDMDQKMNDAVKSLGVAEKYFDAFEQIDAVEQIIEPDEQIYVLGKINYDNGSKTIGSDDGNQFIISDRSERETLSSFYWRVAGWLLFGLILAAGGAFAWLAHNPPK